MERPPAPPEAVLIRLAREAAGIPVAAAAKGAGVSVARWSQIESGSEIRHGNVSPVNGRAGTIARMAAEVGVTPERMAAEGHRPDAAEILREIRRQAEPEPAPRRRFLPAPTPEMERDLAPVLSEIRSCAMVAAAAYPGQRLSGRQVFPDSPTAPPYWPAARVFWDAAAAAGVGQEDIPETVATLVTWRRQLDERDRQGGSAAGLGRHPPVRALL
jgi:transcriptional regulator with XRE-family HTH domain